MLVFSLKIGHHPTSPAVHGTALSIASILAGPLAAGLAPPVSQIAMYGYRGGALGGTPEFGVSDVFGMPGLQNKVLKDVEQIRQDLQAKGIINNDWSKPSFSIPIPTPTRIDRRDIVEPTPSFLPPMVSTPNGSQISQAVKRIIIEGGISVAAPKPTPPPLVISPSASTSGHAEGVKTTPTPTTTSDKPMDLGDILGTAVGIYKDYQVAKTIPQYADYKYGGPAVQQPALNVPFVDVIPEQQAGTKGMVWNPRANCGQGGWVKSRRRRRRRLATVSDIKDLAALKSVLGQGKAFETWIATHS